MVAISELDYKKRRFEGAVRALSDLERKRQLVERDFEEKIGVKTETVLRYAAELVESFDGYVRTSDWRMQSEIKKVRLGYEQQIKDLEKQVKEGGIAQSEQNNSEDIAKATTLSIIDSILFAISNWSVDGQVAPDIELACQSILFPIVYEPVMKGESDYYLPVVPASANEIVKRGREFVKHIRAVSDLSLVDPDGWEEFSSMIQQWWVNDALPLLYGARDNDWEKTEAFPLEIMTIWRDKPASRALQFPLIFDGMELVRKHGDEIREKSGLPAFNKSTISTRLEPND